MSGARRTRAILLFASLACLLLPASSCSRAGRPLSVVLISIDTLRPDHLGCYGYPRPTSPALDALARRGARFATARSTTSWTLPSHLALFTGLSDEVHGVVFDHVATPRDRTMLAQRFAAAGYRTAGFYGGPYLHPVFGFGRGFERYENCGAPAPYEILTEEHTPRQRMELMRESERESHRVKTAPELTRRALAFLEDVGDEPFFLFIHHWDVHYDYNPPVEYARIFAPGLTDVDRYANVLANDAIHAEMPPAAWAELMACYDGEIRFVDDHLAKLFTRLDALGRTDDTLVVVVADHGEEFFEHGSIGHRKNLFEESLRVPLLIAGPPIRPGTVVESPVRLYDVAPTVLALAGIEFPAWLEGDSLVPLLEDEAQAPARLRALPYHAELTLLPWGSAEDGVLDHYLRHVVHGRDRYKWMRVRAHAYDVAEPSVFAEAPFDVPEPLEMLFDLVADPREAESLAAKDPETLERMRVFATTWREELARQAARLRDNPGQDLEPWLQRQIEQAGYTAGGR